MRLKGKEMRRAFATACVLTPLMLCGCAGGFSGAGDFCRLYEPVYWGDGDSAETVASITRNNAVWLELCGD